MGGREIELGTSGAIVKRQNAWRDEFIEKLRESGNVRYSCTKAGISSSTAYRARARSTRFARAWEDALSVVCDELEVSAFRRAIDGVERPVYHKGELVGHYRTFSDRLTMFLLTALRPEKYGGNANEVPHELAAKVYVEFPMDDI